MDRNPDNYAAAVSKGTNEFADEDIEVGQRYYYRLTAVDIDGNESRFTETVNVRIQDTEAPPTPGGLAVNMNGPHVCITWTASDAADLAAYRLYRGVAQNPTVRLAELGPGTSEYIDSDVRGLTTYYYRITAVDVIGNESGFSSDAQITVPSSTDLEVTSLPVLRWSTTAPYPNPAKEAINILVDAPASSLLYVSVVDLLGRRIIPPTLVNVTAGHDQVIRIDLPSILSGTYAYVLHNSGNNRIVGRGLFTLLP